jgi:hypothetical protein
MGIGWFFAIIINLPDIFEKQLCVVWCMKVSQRLVLAARVRRATLAMKPKQGEPPTKVQE